MKKLLLDDLIKSHLRFKLTTALLFALLFLGTVQLTDYNLERSSDKIEKRAAMAETVTASLAYSEYYNRTNQTERFEETVRIREDIEKRSVPNALSGPLYTFNGVLLEVLGGVDPFFPKPCIYTISENCYIYYDTETISEINNSLQRVGTEESLRDFSQRYNLSASEEFYSNYSDDNPGAVGNLFESSKRLNTSVYAVNTLYFSALGFLLATITVLLSRSARRIYRKITSFITGKGESIGAELLSEIFWPPASALAVVVEDEKLLAVDAGEYLMLPGGLLEKNESFEEAAFREVKEETGLEVEIGEMIQEETRVGVEVAFSASLKGGDLEGSWEGSPKWIPLEDIENYTWRYNRDIRSLVEKALNVKR